MRGLSSCADRTRLLGLEARRIDADNTLDALGNSDGFFHTGFRGEDTNQGHNTIRRLDRNFGALDAVRGGQIGFYLRGDPGVRYGLV